MAVIYRITNMVNNKFYIGSAESFARREWQHKNDLKRNAHKNPHLQASWNKYGAEMFVFEIMEQIPEGEATLAWEDKWLRDCVGRKDCYNVNTLATSPRSGLTWSEKSKQQLSINRKGKHAGTAHYRYGQTVSEEVRKKISAAQLGKPKAAGRKVSAEGKAKIRAAAEAGNYSHWQGRKHTEESKAKMRKEVVATDPAGKEHIFASLTETLQTLGLLMPTLNRALKSGKPLSKGPRKEWAFRYESTCIPPTRVL